jgi:ribokinase
MLVVLGNACKDITFRVAALPVPGETLTALETTYGLGGKGFNQAIAASRSGAIVKFVAAVGNDSTTVSIRALLQAEQMTDAGLVEQPGETDFSAIIVAAGGENVIVTHSVRAASLAFEDIAARLSFTSGDVLLLQGNLSAATTRAATRLAKAAGAGVIFNPAPYQDWCKSLAPDIDVLILNTLEAGLWSGVSARDSASAGLDVPFAIVTAGAEGCLVKRAAMPAERFAAPRVTAVDASGAGDVFAGVFAAAWSRSGDAASAVRLALLAASDSVTRPGALASIPSREAFLAMQRERG